VIDESPVLYGTVLSVAVVCDWLLFSAI